MTFRKKLLHTKYFTSFLMYSLKHHYEIVTPIPEGNPSVYKFSINSNATHKSSEVGMLILLLNF